MHITEREERIEGATVSIHILENARGARVELSSLGAGVLGVLVPDREGRLGNVALGYERIGDYMGDGPCMGKCPGRYANRIARGHLEVGGRTYSLAVNCGPHHLHGGPGGFHNRIWTSRALADGVEFSYVSADGEENYPGRVEIRAVYRWSDDNVLSLELQAVADAETVVNLTNHTYWNLEGCGAGTALGHEMRMKASRWLVTDSTLAPTGELAPTAGTPMDFSRFKTLGRDIRADFEPLRFGKGYDHCWAIDGWEPGRFTADAVEVRDPRSGRTMTVGSDQPGVQIYTGNWLKGSPLGRGGREFEDYDAVAVEMQGFPDAPNIPSFPSQTLRPGETYRRIITYAFSIY